MTERCRSFEHALAEYDADTLAPEAEREMRAHLATCEPCRESALSRFPTLLFAAAGPETADEVYWARFWRDLQPGLDAVERRRAERRSGPSPLVGLLAAGSGLCAGVLLAFYAIGGSGGRLPVTAPPAPAAEGAREYRLDLDGTPLVFIVDRKIDL